MTTSSWSLSRWPWVKVWVRGVWMFETHKRAPPVVPRASATHVAAKWTVLEPSGPTAARWARCVVETCSPSRNFPHYGVLPDRRAFFRVRRGLRPPASKPHVHACSLHASPRAPATDAGSRGAAKPQLASRIFKTRAKNEKTACLARAFHKSRPLFFFFINPHYYSPARPGAACPGRPRGACRWPWPPASRRWP